MNQVIQIGRLTRDPELRFIPNSGTAVCRFTLAVNRDFKKEGQPEADFFNIVVWGKSAENCANYLKKGRLVAINGRLQNNNYEDQNGTKHYNVEIHANRVQFLEWGDNGNNSNNNNRPGYDQRTGYEQQNGSQSNNQLQQNQQQQSYQEDFSGFQAIEGDSEIPF